MNINFSLIGQMVTFAILLYVVYKYVWPPLIRAIEERQTVIAQGLQAAEAGEQALKSASEQREGILQEARAQAKQLVDDGEKRRQSIVAGAQEEANSEKQRIVEDGQRQLEQERMGMQKELEQHLSSLVIQATSQLIDREVDENKHRDLLDKFKKEFVAN